MRLILAGNYQQFRDIAKPEDKYLAHLPDDLLGYNSCDLIEEGTFFLRKDFKPEEIYYYCISHNISMSNTIKEMARVEIRRNILEVENESRGIQSCLVRTR